ncbi:DUF397 domain-containing protein [Streptomyces racemochromogenes]|uniref:DUF397 domain-containing protein n=1 Tax=Streptomyces racemochromogenes TaxID=67353 RepID=UPI0035E610D4
MTTNPAPLAPLPWRKSSYSGANESQCVEIAPLTNAGLDGVAIRDSKKPNGPMLQIRPATFHAFVKHVSTQT